MLETPMLETPMLGTPMLETPMLGTPILGTAMLGTPMLETPMFETPMFETPMLETPMLGTPMLGTPMLGTTETTRKGRKLRLFFWLETPPLSLSTLSDPYTDLSGSAGSLEWHGYNFTLFRNQFPYIYRKVFA